MPLNLAKLKEQTKRISRKFGDETLTIEYYPHKYTSTQQSEFEDKLNTVGAVCSECDASMLNTEGDLLKVCPQCKTVSNRAVLGSQLLAGWLEDVVVSADWADEQGEVPINRDDMLKRLPFEVMQFAFTMIAEDKAGPKGSRGR